MARGHRLGMTAALNQSGGRALHPHSADQPLHMEASRPAWVLGFCMGLREHKLEASPCAAGLPGLF